MLIDLQLNYPILEEQARRAALLVAEIMRDLAHITDLPPYAGSEEHRQLAANWLSGNGEAIPKERVLLCAGGHHAIVVALLGLGLRGQRIAVDPLTYSNFKVQAAIFGIELLPCAGDEQGMVPSELAETCVRQKAKAVYLMPSLHNPLGIVMPEKRRHAICEVARQNDLLIIDDDAYGFLEANAPPSFAVLARERAVSVYSFTKVVCPLTKVSFLTVPREFSEQLAEVIRITSSGASLLFAEVICRLIQSGEVSSFISAKREDAARLQTLARSALRGCKMQAHPTSYHVWIELPEQKPATRLAAELKSQGILVSSSAAYRASEAVEANGVRVALGNVRDPALLEHALEIVRDGAQT
jgi:DNA-binding transcriptional MocR family regulator